MTTNEQILVAASGASLLCELVVVFCFRGLPLPYFAALNVFFLAYSWILLSWVWKNRRARLQAGPEGEPLVSRSEETA
ncbi:hypothetical protein QG37_03710 [Candidozyma auris]|nr:hypothetical protein QG37_03710 [[Candida] auris]